MPLVKSIAGRIGAGLPASIRTEDLISAGTFGLMDAIAKFNPKLGASFGTYCSVRIRGAILDELRNLNWVPHVQSTRAAKVSAAVNELRHELGRIPTPAEIAGKTGMSIADIKKAVGPRFQNMPSPDEELPSEGFLAATFCDPVELLELKESRELLAKEIRKLAKTERLIIMLYYFEELTMRQIGELLNLTESRVCQIHADIIALMQQRLKELDETQENHNPAGRR